MCKLCLPLKLLGDLLSIPFLESSCILKLGLTFYGCCRYRFVKVVPDVKSVEGKCLLSFAPSVSISPVWMKILIIVKNVEYAGRSRKCDISFVKLLRHYLNKIHMYILVYERLVLCLFAVFLNN